MAELVDALDLGSSGVTRESSSLSFRTNTMNDDDYIILYLDKNFPTASRLGIFNVDGANLQRQCRKRRGIGLEIFVVETTSGLSAGKPLNKASFKTIAS